MRSVKELLGRGATWCLKRKSGMKHFQSESRPRTSDFYRGGQALDVLPLIKSVF